MPSFPDPAATLLFDLDGTITDSFTGIERSFHHGLAAIDAPTPPPELVAGIAGPPMRDTLQSLGLDDAGVDAAFTAYRERYVTTGWLENRVFPGMSELLHDLADAGRTLAVATSKDEEMARRILQHFELADLFAVIGGASDAAGRAAKHDVVEHVIAQVSGPYVMVGDRSHDVEGAAHHGIDTVHVAWGYAAAGEGEEARWRADSVDDLRRLLG